MTWVKNAMSNMGTFGIKQKEFYSFLCKQGKRICKAKLRFSGLGGMTEGKLCKLPYEGRSSCHFFSPGHYFSASSKHSRQGSLDWA